MLRDAERAHLFGAAPTKEMACRWTRQGCMASLWFCTTAAPTPSTSCWPSVRNQRDDPEKAHLFGSQQRTTVLVALLLRCCYAVLSALLPRHCYKPLSCCSCCRRCCC